MLPDGTYEALIVDAHAGEDGALHLEVTVTTGPRKGEVVRIKGSYPGHRETDLLAAPATLTVRDGMPRLRLDG